MRRLHTRRAGDRQEDALEGLPRQALEGDPADAPSDEGPVLHPFAATVPPPAAALREAEQLGRTLDAIATLRRTLAGQPDHRDARLRLAHLLQAAGDADEALDVLSEGLRVTPGVAALLAGRGALLVQLGRLAEAEEDLRRAVRTDPAGLEGHLHLGIALLRRGRGREAVPLLSRASALAPDNAESALHLGEALAQAGDLERATEELHRAARLLPNDPRPWKLLGRLLDRMGRTEEASAMHRRAREAGA